jgi:Tol biopolymer transport system component
MSVRPTAYRPVALVRRRQPFCSARPGPIASARQPVASWWSPDGALIAFTSDRDGDYDIFTVPSANYGTGRNTIPPAWITAST